MAHSGRRVVHRRTETFNKLLSWATIPTAIIALYFGYPYLFQLIGLIWFSFKWVIWAIFYAIYFVISEILSVIWFIVTIPWYYWPTFLTPIFYTIFAICFIGIHIFGQWLFDYKAYEIYYNPHRLLFICLMIYYIQIKSVITVDSTLLWTEYILHSSDVKHWTFRILAIELFLKYAIMVHQPLETSYVGYFIHLMANKWLPLLFASCYIGSHVLFVIRAAINPYIPQKYKDVYNKYNIYIKFVTVSMLFMLIWISWSNDDTFYYYDLNDYLFSLQTATLYHSWFNSWVQFGVVFTVWFIIGACSVFQPQWVLYAKQHTTFINERILRPMVLLLWCWFINHWIASYFINLVYIFNFCFYKITTILLSDLGGIFGDFGRNIAQNMKQNKDKLTDGSTDIQDFQNDNLVVYGYFRKYIENEVDYVIPNEIILEILKFYNVKYSIEWSIDNCIDYGNKLLICNDNNTARWSGEAAFDPSLDEGMKTVVAVSNHSIGSNLHQDSNLNMKIVDLRFKIRSIINPGYPMVSILFVEENELETIRATPERMKDISDKRGYSWLVQRVNVFTQVDSFWEIKKLKQKITKRSNENDVISMRFDFEKEIVKYFRNDIDQGLELEISKDKKYKICAVMCFQGDEISFV